MLTSDPTFLPIVGGALLLGGLVGHYWEWIVERLLLVCEPVPESYVVTLAGPREMRHLRIIGVDERFEADAQMGIERDPLFDAQQYVREVTAEVMADLLCHFDLDAHVAGQDVVVHLTATTITITYEQIRAISDLVAAFERATGARASRVFAAHVHVLVELLREVERDAVHALRGGR